MQKSELILEILRGDPICDKLKIGLSVSEIRKYLVAKHRETQFAEGYIAQSVRLKSQFSNVGILLENFLGDHQRTMRSRTTGKKFVWSLPDYLYSSGPIGNVSRAIFEIEDGYRRIYSRSKTVEDRYPPAIRVLRALKRSRRGEVEHERLGDSVNVDSQSAHYGKILSNLSSLGLLEDQGEYCRRTQLLEKIYSEGSRIWRGMKDWKYRSKFLVSWH